MNWVELATAVGFGTVIAQIIDVKVVQPLLARRNRSGWLRDKRYEAFSRLAQNLTSFGLEGSQKLKSAFDHYAIATDALLLIDDRGLCERIDVFIVKRDEMERKGDSGQREEAEKLYSLLVTESRFIVNALRIELRSDEV